MLCIRGKKGQCDGDAIELSGCQPKHHQPNSGHTAFGCHWACSFLFGKVTLEEVMGPPSNTEGFSCRNGDKFWRGNHMMHHDASHASCPSQARTTPPLRTCAISLFWKQWEQNHCHLLRIAPRLGEGDVAGILVLWQPLSKSQCADHARKPSIKNNASCHGTLGAMVCQHCRGLGCLPLASGDPVVFF